jgi:hypothetical protein
MLVSGELFAAPKRAGASDVKAEAAAALIAGHEFRLNRLADALCGCNRSAPVAIALIVILIILR